MVCRQVALEGGCEAEGTRGGKASQAGAGGSMGEDSKPLDTSAPWVSPGPTVRRMAPPAVARDKGPVIGRGRSAVLSRGKGRPHGR